MNGDEYQDHLSGLTDDDLLGITGTPRPFEPAYNQAALELAELRRRGLAPPAGAIDRVSFAVELRAPNAYDRRALDRLSFVLELRAR